MSNIEALANMAILIALVSLFLHVLLAIWKHSSLKKAEGSEPSRAYLSGIYYGVVISLSVFLVVIGLALRVMAIAVTQTTNPIPIPSLNL